MTMEPSACSIISSENTNADPLSVMKSTRFVQFSESDHHPVYQDELKCTSRSITRFQPCPKGRDPSINARDIQRHYPCPSTAIKSKAAHPRDVAQDSTAVIIEHRETVNRVHASMEGLSVAVECDHRVTAMEMMPLQE